MPFKCINCDKVTHTDEPDCKCEKPNIMKCATIHFITQNGVGSKYSTARQVMKNSDPSIEPTGAIEKVTLNLGCSAKVTPRLNATPARFAVTCLDCIANFPLPKDEDSLEESL